MTDYNPKFPEPGMSYYNYRSPTDWQIRWNAYNPTAGWSRYANAPIQPNYNWSYFANAPVYTPVAQAPTSKPKQTQNTPQQLASLLGYSSYSPAGYQITPPASAPPAIIEQGGGVGAPSAENAMTEQQYASYIPHWAGSNYTWKQGTEDWGHELMDMYANSGYWGIPKPRAKTRASGTSAMRNPAKASGAIASTLSYYQNMLADLQAQQQQFESSGLTNTWSVKRQNLPRRIARLQELIAHEQQVQQTWNILTGQGAPVGAGTSGANVSGMGSWRI